MVCNTVMKIRSRKTEHHPIQNKQTAVAAILFWKRASSYRMVKCCVNGATINDPLNCGRRIRI